MKPSKGNHDGGRKGSLRKNPSPPLPKVIYDWPRDDYQFKGPAEYKGGIHPVLLAGLALFFFAVCYLMLGRPLP